jgi:hypothetical protein
MILTKPAGILEGAERLALKTTIQVMSLGFTQK